MSTPAKNSMSGGGILSTVSRRDLMRAGLIAGAGILLTGCAGGSRRVARLPDVAWPDDSTTGTSPRRGRSVPYERLPDRTPSMPDAPPGGVMSRSTWARGNPIMSRMNPPLQHVGRITIHHDGMPPVAIQNRGDVMSRLEQIREAHLSKGWGDIGHHYIVDPFGQVWEGRPIQFQGAHVGGQNGDNIGILTLGNFEAQSPTGVQVDTLDRFVVSQMRRYRIAPGRIYTHRELAPTLCPGRNLQRYMDMSRRRGGAIAMA
ncbi:MAG: peptidoglycan recognition family protein [Planctomycetota bacterium]|nr:peptidoglycan recognition family protein [Planctomycetota bacterium]